MPEWRITAFVSRTADGAVEVSHVSPSGFIRREHVGKSYPDEDSVKSAVSESFRVWSGIAVPSAAVAVVCIDDPPDPSSSATPDDESAPEAETDP